MTPARGRPGGPDLAALMATVGTDADLLPPDIRQPERRFNLGSPRRRRFWQRRSDYRDPTTASHLVHAPLASDIAMTSADLLFGEAPDLTIPQPTTKAGKPKTDRGRDAAQQALEDLVDTVNLWTGLLEAAETGAAVGGVYLRPVWDTEVADHPLLTAVDQQHAVPDFAFGQLVAVTFAEQVATDAAGSLVWRHLERHEPARILHGLYAGTATRLGKPAPLASHPATARYQPVVPLPAGIPRPLLISYVPNVRPYRRRGNRTALGRSNYAGSDRPDHQRLRLLIH